MSVKVSLEHSGTTSLTLFAHIHHKLSSSFGLVRGKGSRNFSTTHMPHAWWDENLVFGVILGQLSHYLLR